MANFFKPSTKKQSAGQVISVLIERLDHNGTGVGKYQNKPVFIESTLPKEQVKAKLTETKGKFFKAQLTEVVVPSEQRIQPSCTHFKTCGGCDLQHLTFDQHLAYKQKKVIDLFSRNQLLLALPWQKSITSEPWQYRRKARIGVQYNKLGEPIIGFRQRSSNNLVSLKQCPILIKPAKNIFTHLKSVIKMLELPKSIGHVEVIYTQFITLIIRQLVPLNEHDTELWTSLADQQQWQIYIDDGKKIKPLTHTTPLYYQLTDYSSNAQATDLSSVLYNKSLRIYFEPKDFIQVNHNVNESMIKQAIEWLALKEDDQVLDLFCGLGNFSLPIAQQVKNVIGVEGQQAMVDKAAFNAEMNNITNAQFFQSDLNNHWLEQTWADKQYTKALLDPARAGAFEAIEQLIKLNITHVVYVSCDPATLAKDSQLLVSNGYTIEKIAIMDMFAQTKHIETMVLFKK